MKSGEINSSSELGNVKREENFIGVTDSNGLYTVVFSIPFSETPLVHSTIKNQSILTQGIRVVSVTTNGFSVHVYQRNSINLLGSDLLLAGITNVSGITVDVTVKEQ